MRCPIDNDILNITDKQGIEIDYCPSCRGVWLDRGELDKLISKSSFYETPTASTERHRPVYQDHKQSAHYEESRDHHYQKPYKKKKENFLSDLFDF